jgi:hypothetical protein
MIFSILSPFHHRNPSYTLPIGATVFYEGKAVGNVISSFANGYTNIRIDSSELQNKIAEGKEAKHSLSFSVVYEERILEVG